MRTNSLNILLLDQGRQSLPFLKSLTGAGHRVSIVCNTRVCEGYFSRYPVKRLIWPSYMKDPAGFKKLLIEFLKSHNIDITFSMSDISTEILSKNRKLVSNYTKVVIPEYAKFLEASDKLKLMTFCMNNDIPCPVTYDLNVDTDIKLLSDLNFPVIVKPRRGFGALGVQRLEHSASVAEKTPRLTEKYGPLLIQEYIPQEGGMQYKALAYLDEKSDMKVCMVIRKPRFFPVDGGTSTITITVDRPDIVHTCKKLLEGIRWKGVADVDLILDPRSQVVKVLEINPRASGCMKICFAAGIDFADLYLKHAFGKPIPKISNYKMGISCRNIFMETLWYLFSTRSMKKTTQPSFFKFFGKLVTYQTFSLDDPLTGIGFFLNMTRNYLSPTNLMEKFTNN